MRGEATNPRPGGTAAPLRGFAAILVALVAARASAADLSGRADLSYADTESTQSASEYLRQVYLLEYRRQMSQPTSYRLALRYQDDRGTSLLPEGPSRLRSRILEPSGTIDHRLDGFGMSAQYRRNHEDSFERGTAVSRTIARYGAKTFVRPFEDAEVNLGLDRLAFDATQVDTRDDRLSLGFRYSGEELRFSNENRLQFFEDARAKLSRLSMGPRITTSYIRNASDAYSLSATYVIDYFRTEQRTGADTVLSELQPVAGLYANDDLPFDTDPMPSTPGLIDRVFDVSAGISLGPSAASFENIAIDMGRFATVEELRIHVRGSDGAPVPFGGPILWTIYASADGVRWAAIPGAIKRFDPSMSAWTFTQLCTDNASTETCPAGRPTARFFKAVNFGVNTIETFVTEVQAFEGETIRPNELRVSSVLRQGLVIVAGARPWPRLSLAYSASGNADAMSAYGSGRRWSSDVSSNLEARLGPFRGFVFGGAQSVRYARQALGGTQGSNGLAASVTYIPIERFETQIDARRTDDRVETPSAVTRATTSRVSLASRMEIYPSVRLNASGGLSVQDIVGGAVSQYATAEGALSMDLHRDLRFGLGASVQRRVEKRGETSQQLPLGIVQFATYAVYTAEGEYRASAQLRLLARLGYAIGESEKGLVQTYRAAWSPFPEGAVQLALDYVEDIDPLTGRALRRIAASPYWAVNRHTVLQLSYNKVRGRSGEPVRQENLYLTLSVRL